MANAIRIAQLITKQLQTELSMQEQKELETWIAESSSNREFMDIRMQPEVIMAGVKALLEKDTEGMRRKFEARYHTLFAPATDSRIQTRMVHWQRSLIAAAAVIMLAWIGVYSWNTSPSRSFLSMVDLAIKLQETVKATDRPGLSLPDGNILFLDRKASGVIWEKGGWRISQVDSQHIVYAYLPGKQRGRISGTGYLSFSTPFGQSWKVSLPDGSQIQLSTGSSLLYASDPSGPVHKERVLALHGEAWFDVTSDARNPLIVATRKGTTTVMGTAFDIRDYVREDSSRVTLVRGSVQVSNGSSHTTLLPGEEARITSYSTDIRLLRNVDTLNRLNWRYNYFDFTDLNIHQIMQKLTQWYGMDEVIFRGKVDTTSPGILGGGHVPKDVSLHELLDKLNTTDLHFDIEGKKISVSRLQ